MTTSGQLPHPEKYRCGKCGENIGCYTPLKPETYPSPGDLSVCSTCGTLHRFTEDGIARMSPDEEATLGADVRAQLERVRGAIETVHRPFPPEYYEQIETMAEAAKAWLREHPSACLVLCPVDVDKLGLNRAQLEALKQEIAKRPGETMGLAVDLGRCISWWGGNEETRELLRVMKKVNRHATYIQATAAFGLVFPRSEVEA